MKTTEPAYRSFSIDGPVRVCVVVFVALVATVALSDTAQAQRPFRLHDPFYRGETARRAFFDTYAFTGELSYRAQAAVQNNGIAAQSLLPFGLSFRLDYQLASQMELSAIWDASGTNVGRTIFISWVGLKYYWTVDNSDYSFRLAVDPASDGRLGFPQMDLAFISTQALTPIITSDFAIGLRRVQIGFQQLVPADETAVPTDDAAAQQILPNTDILNTHALGFELHMMWSYNFIFDPAASNAFVSLIGEGGQYTIIESLAAGDPEVREASKSSSEFRGGVVWTRFGIEYNRPGYQVIPFLAIPLTQWTGEDVGFRQHMHFGLRLMLR